MSVSRCSPDERCHSDTPMGLYRRKWGILHKLSECPQHQKISIFRELLLCVTLWIAALS